jgi:hypothetical protein
VSSTSSCSKLVPTCRATALWRCELGYLVNFQDVIYWCTPLTEGSGLREQLARSSASGLFMVGSGIFGERLMNISCLHSLSFYG